MYETALELDIVGRAADFCPICRQVRAFTIRKEYRVRVSIGVHAFIPIVQEQDAKAVGYDRVCETCNLDLPVGQWNYLTLADRNPLTLEDLVRRTNPQLRERVAVRLAVEDRVLRGSLNPDERRTLLAEPFLLLEDRLRGLHGERPGIMERLIFPAAWPAALLGLLFSGMLPPALQSPVQAIGGLVFGVSALACVLFGFARMNRKARMNQVLRLEVRPLLGRALKPLAPDAAELTSVLSELRGRHHRCGELLTAEAILEEMNAVKS